MSAVKQENTVVELWKAISYVTQTDIDMAVDKGDKARAANLCMCSSKGMDIFTAKRLIEWRLVELRKRI
jgi:hypothetical protein